MAKNMQHNQNNRKPKNGDRNNIYESKPSEYNSDSENSNEDSS